MKIACKLHAIAIAAIFTACGGGTVEPAAPAGVAVSDVTVTSRQLAPNGPIAVDNTCDGNDSMPGLEWSAVPSATRSIAIVVDDPDAPGGTFTHFIVYDLPADAHALKPDAVPAAPALVGKNDFGNVRWNGPCPPRGEEHTYRFQLYALDAPLALPDGADRKQLADAMNGHVIGRGMLSATFGH